MQHANPLLHGDCGSRFITVGEIMLRLTPPNYEKIRMTTSFEASYGGSEANIALAPISALTALSLRWFRTTALERAQFVCCAATTSTVRR